MNIYEYTDYKQALRSIMEDRRKRFGSRFTFEKMAHACGVQKTYLSKVLNSSAHLNLDQLFSATEYLNLSHNDYEYLSLLRESQYGSNLKRIKIIHDKISKIRRDKLRAEAIIKIAPEQSKESFQWEYYTDIELQLVHMFLTIPAYAKNPNLIGSHIGIDEIRLQNILIKLQKWNLVTFNDGKYNSSDPLRHLNQDSPVFTIFAILMRLKTVEYLRLEKEKSDLNSFFSVLFSANPKIHEKIKKKILQFIKETQDEVISSKSEELYQLNIDFFKWG